MTGAEDALCCNEQLVGIAWIAMSSEIKYK